MATRWWRFWDRPRGEVSALRTRAPDLRFGLPYQLNSQRVNYELARRLYRNTEDGYKLGAAFARPIINTTAGFVGVPHFGHEDPEAAAALEGVMARWTGTLHAINRNTLRDGDVFARLVRVADEFRRGVETWDLRLIPPEWVTPTVDVATGRWSRLTIVYPLLARDEAGRERQYRLTEVLTPERRTLVPQTDAPAEVRALADDGPNPWGFIPVVHFRNEPEETELFGASDLEPVEPFLKAYHDVMLFAIQGAKLFSRPKVKIKVQNARRFLSDNFPAEEVSAGRIRFADREIFLLQQGDDVEFITADSGLAGATALLQFLFMCIVDVSETPEFAFGTAVSSSKASVSEQMVPLVRKVRRKRGMIEPAYRRLASMWLAMWSLVEGRTLASLDVALDWDEVSPRDDQAVAATIKTLVEGLSEGVEGGLLSLDAAAEFLRRFVPSMMPWTEDGAEDDERRRVIRALQFLGRVRDGGLPETGDAQGAVD